MITIIQTVSVVMFSFVMTGVACIAMCAGNGMESISLYDERKSFGG